MQRDDNRCVGVSTRACYESHDVDMAEATGLREARRLVESKHLINIII
ncbi:hypothetical protein A2U01_0047499 [Trifolium medium]|uniref:RNase H type-1 domain-containing protein n=1 Tax=Trifolium medium TaxID=97028 RepID=A0A392QR48_9FABA|nr:hypothetical protein [Trifolium medium]